MIDVVKLLAALRIEVKDKRGGELWAPCPFPWHDEKTPSWSIQSRPGPKCGQHHCFGCKEGGGPVDLVMHVIGITESGARNWIDRKGLHIEDAVSLKVSVEVLPTKYDEFRLPYTVKGIGCMHEWPTPFKRRAEERGLSSRQINRWSLGYCVDGEYQGRIIIPIYDENNVLWSFTARTIFGEKPKYKTASKKEGAEHDAVFGAQHWPWGNKRKRVFVTEGAFNALAIERVFPKASIAALDGSDLYSAQAAAIGSFEEIVIVSDPDLAGDLLASKLKPYARWKKLWRVVLPEKEDANSLPPRELARLIADAESAYRNRVAVP